MNDLTTLPDLARRINDAHDHFEAALRAGLQHARVAGELLLQAKGQLPHGQWLPWLKANCKVTPRSAQQYMRVASRWDELVGKCETVSHLTFRDALKLLTDAPAADAHEEPPWGPDWVRVNGRVYKTPLHEPGLDLAGKSWESFLGSVRRLGQLLAVHLDENGDCIDGRQRLRACAVLGLEPKAQVIAGLTPEEKLEHWERMNLIRAHLEPYSELV